MSPTAISYASRPSQLLQALELMLLDLRLDDAGARVAGNWGHGLGFGWGGIGSREPVIPKYPAFFLTPATLDRQYDGEWSFGVNVWLYLRVTSIDEGHLLMQCLDKGEQVAQQIRRVQDRLVRGVQLSVESNTDYNVAYSANPENPGQPRLDVHVITHTIRPQSMEEILS